MKGSPGLPRRGSMVEASRANPLIHRLSCQRLASVGEKSLLGELI